MIYSVGASALIVHGFYLSKICRRKTKTPSFSWWNTKLPIRSARSQDYYPNLIGEVTPPIVPARFSLAYGLFIGCLCSFM